MRGFHRVLGILLILFFIFPIFAGCKGTLEKEEVGEKVKPQKPDKKYYKLGPKRGEGVRAWVPKELEGITLCRKEWVKMLTPGDKYFNELRQACEEVFFSVGSIAKGVYPLSIQYVRAGHEVVILQYKMPFYVERPGVDWFSDVTEEDKKPFFVLDEIESPDVLHLACSVFTIDKDLSQVRKITKKFWEEYLR
ncbi:MAG: hypothetical protein QME54_02555 [Actinomycetota bacterium]|nr:hypothetical protein [Actinomycetota bacterium]